MPANVITLSITKITPPGRRPEILSRSRLLERLEQLLDKKLVLVTAPAGYGKTSLLVDLAATTRMPVCWLTLDPLDQEPQRFLAYFNGAIALRFPRFGGQSRSALGGLVSLEAGLENLVTTITNEIERQVHEHFLLVLDDYHLVDAVPEIRTFIGRFVQLAGENCHLLLASRRLPAIPDLPVLVARQQVGGFDLNELAFRPEEIRLLFECAYHTSLGEGEVEDLHRRTEGWVTGLHLARLDGGRSLPDLSRLARAVGVDLSDYFEQQVLGHQSPAVRLFLLQTSLLEEFDAALCDSVLGVGDWRTIMAEVRRSNLFVLPVGTHGEWLRYHALFRDFLQARIWQESPETVQAILLRLAEVSEQEGEWEKAHYALSQAGDQASLAALVGRAGPALVQAGRILTLSAWLDELPDSHVQQDPSLLLLAGVVSLVRGQVQGGLSMFERAAAALRLPGDRPALAGALVRQSWARRLLGAYEAAVADADEAIGLLAGEPSAAVILAEACRMKGLALFRLGRMPEADRYLAQALEMFQAQGREGDIPLAQMELGMTRRALGDPASALACYEKALGAWQQQGNLTSQATLLNSLGVLHHQLGEYEKAVQAFERGLDCARRSGYTRSEALLLSSLGDLYADVGDLEAAGLVFQRAEGIAASADDQFLARYTRLALAALARRKGEVEQARRLLEEAASSLRLSGSHYEAGLLALEQGRLSLAAGDSTTAIQNLQEALQKFESGGTRSEAGWARVWLAAALAAASESASPLSLVEASLSVAEPGVVPASLLPALCQALPWLEALPEGEVSRPALRHLIQAAAGFRAGLPALRRRLRRLGGTVPAAAPELAIRAFGRAQVRVRGRLVTGPQWHSRTVKELFFLFLHAPTPLTREQVGVVLWPESDSARLSLRFKNELYRLRRAVGREAIRFDGSTYSFNRSLEYEYDVESFESCLARLRLARDPGEKLRLCQEAVALVRGPYLEDFGSPWLALDRERLRLEHLDTLLMLARLLLERGEGQECARVCHYALVIDRTLEEAHRLLMRVHASRGDRMGVTRQYQACRDALEDELGVPVSLETEALYQRLTA